MRRKCIIDSKGILVNEEVFFRATARGASNGLWVGGGENPVI